MIASKEDDLMKKEKIKLTRKDIVNIFRAAGIVSFGISIIVSSIIASVYVVLVFTKVPNIKEIKIGLVWGIIVFILLSFLVFLLIATINTKHNYRVKQEVEDLLSYTNYTPVHPQAYEYYQEFFENSLKNSKLEVTYFAKISSEEKVCIIMHIENTHEDIKFEEIENNKFLGNYKVL